MGDYMECIYTIGFTKKCAKKFFGLLKENQIELLLDVRLNNTSQLAGFSKYPDIEFFLNEICQISYISDTHFAREEWILPEHTLMCNHQPLLHRPVRCVCLCADF